MTTDFRALCADLADALDNAIRVIHREGGTLHISTADPVLAHARIALAQSEPPADRKAPTVMEIVELAAELGQVDLVRAALARWGSPAPQPQPQPPAAGEVAEVVAALRSRDRWHNLTDAQVDRAADLLERLSEGPAVQSREPSSVTNVPSDKELRQIFDDQNGCINGDQVTWMWWPDFRDAARAVLARWGNPALQPIPVTERLPEARDCIANPRTGQGQWCWGWARSCSVETVVVPFSGKWRMMRREWLSDDASHWLPASALPLPSGEVE